MKRTETECLYRRGKRGRLCLRKRIPAAVQAAYPPGVTHVVISLGTTDLAAAKSRLHREMVRLEREWKAKRLELKASQKADHSTPDPQATLTSRTIRTVDSLTDEQIEIVAAWWVQSVLLSDEFERQSGLDDEDFDELGSRLVEQREEFGRMFARGQTDEFFPALKSFLLLCGIDLTQTADQAKAATYAFLRAVVKSLDVQLERQRGKVIETKDVVPRAVHPLTPFLPPSYGEKDPTWDAVFECWKGNVVGRPTSTAIASQTPWRDLERFAALNKVLRPAGVTKSLVNQFVLAMKARGLKVKTINGRIGKLRAIFRIAVAREELVFNPTVDAVGFGETGVAKRTNRRLPYSEAQLQTLFGSPVFVQHLRSRGQAREASYWIPIIMFYSGARPEEVAGLAIADVCLDPNYGWYFNIVDRPDPEEDFELFGTRPPLQARTLKNEASIRKVPVARELVELGLFDYIEWLKATGQVALFPGLKPDRFDKLSGSFGKFFGRYLRSIGITDPKVVLYSLRHNMKDILEKAKFDIRYLQRTLGHHTGDGEVTEGYGSDLPLEHLVGYWKAIQFPPIPATRWEPGKGFVRFKVE